jgi:choline kinase/phosphatidylglycerophosphate synthase
MSATHTSQPLSANAAPTQLVILAAGQGSRIRTGEQELPKPLVSVGGVPLLKRSILTAKKAGVTRFVVILGYEAARVRGALEGDAQLSDLNIVWVEHPRFDLSNGVSVLQARQHVVGEFYLTMADHVVEPAIYHALAARPLRGDLTLAIDYKLGDVFDMDDATKVKVGEGDTIAAISKTLEDFDAVDTGVFRCGEGLFRALQAEYDRRGDASLSDGVRALGAEGRAHVVDVGAAWWQDVDDLPTRAEAERRLFVSLTKKIDGPVSRHINRRFSKQITRLVMNTRVVPNHMTAVGLVIGLLSAVVTALATREALWLLPVGGLLYQLSSMIDGCDGEIARLKFLHSDLGEWFDTVSDDVINLSYQLAMGYAISQITGEQVWVWMSAVGVVAGGLICAQMYGELLRSGKGTHLALNWSFEQKQDNLFQKICARFAFVARRDFYALALMFLSFAGVAAMKFGLVLSLVTIGFLVSQWVSTRVAAARAAGAQEGLIGARHSLSTRKA